MKKRINFLFSALMICAAVGVFVGCADNTLYEPEKQAQERELFKEKLSHEVTQAEARENLEKIILDLKIPSTRGGDTNSLPPITSVYTRGKAAVATRAGEEVEPYFHIFNFGDNEGFAIMSGDDRVEPLLALTFKGELAPETEIDNPGFEIAYSRMEDYYLGAIFDTIPSIQPDLPIPPRDTIPLELIARDTTIISTEYFDLPTGPCPVEWGQGRPYNSFCWVPGAYYVNACTGCAATAIAQLMSIHKFPSSYSGYEYNWNEMNLYTNKFSNNPYVSDATKYNRIAHLMRHLGLSENLDMTYGEDLSYANSDRVLPTLLNFGYTNGRKITYDTTYVTDELKNGYPVLIYGFDGDNNGHLWLGHGEMERTRTYIGYNEFDEVILTNTVIDKYILCNWGWDGDDNGYFLSGVFDASEDSIYPLEDITRSEDYKNFEYNLNAFINIRKQ